MTNAAFNENEEKPLDPAVEKIRRRMVRLLTISASSIALSLMAVLGAIVYKSSRSTSNETASITAIHVPNGVLSLSAMVPAGFHLASASLDNGQILMTGTKADGEITLLIYDIHAGRVITTISLTREKILQSEP